MLAGGPTRKHLSERIARTGFPDAALGGTRFFRAATGYRLVRNISVGANFSSPFFSLTSTLRPRAADHIHRELRAREDGLVITASSGSPRGKPSPPRDCRAD